MTKEKTKIPTDPTSYRLAGPAMVIPEVTRPQKTSHRNHATLDQATPTSTHDLRWLKSELANIVQTHCRLLGSSKTPSKATPWSHDLRQATFDKDDKP